MQMENRPEMTFESTLPWPGEKTETLVIHCSDHRFQAQVDEFLRTGLGRESFDRLVVPGGPQFLLAATYFPKFEWAGRRWARFLIKHQTILEIICIAHEDCGWYRELTVGPWTIPLLKERQITDLRKGREVLREMFSGIAVLLYYARPNQHGHVEFLEIS